MAPTEFSKTLGNNLKTLRKQCGFTAEELGALLGISEDEIRKYERGDRAPSIEKAIAVSVALNCSPQAIIEGLDPRSGRKLSSASPMRIPSPEEHRILHYMATDFDGDTKALLIGIGAYMALPPKRRREVMMGLDMQVDEALAKHEISPEDLPEGMDYLRQSLGGLYID